MYQWRKDGVPITGATAATLRLTNLATSDIGSYDVVATGPQSAQTSLPAVLASPIAIRTQPQAQFAVRRGAVVFRVETSTEGPVTYQWLLDDLPIRGATAPEFAIDSAEMLDAGRYNVLVTNPRGSVLSDTARLTVFELFCSRPVAEVGNSVEFTISRRGVPADSYEWRRNGVRISVADPGERYVIASAQHGDTGAYTLVATNGAGTFESNIATLSVGPVAPQIVVPPKSQTTSLGRVLTLSVGAVGNPAIRYQWQKDGVVISGATASIFRIPLTAVTDAGAYRVLVTNSLGTATSPEATIVITNPTPSASRFSAQPTSQTVTAGESLTLSATVNGTGWRYQWLKNGMAIPGATNASLTISVVTEADAALYEVLVANATDTAKSERAVVTVLPSPNEVGRLTNLSVRAFTGIGDRILIVGFTLAGPGGKPVLIRGIGPSLAAFGVNGALTDPRLGVFVGSNEMASNDNWTTDDGRALGAFALTAGSRDAVVSQNLTAQNFTVQISGIGGGVGESLVELYDANPTNSALRLVNLSTRTQLDTGQRLIVGLTITGRQPVRILVRAVGPTLATFGLGGGHPDPVMELYSGSTVIQQNDNWQGDDGRTAGAFPLIVGSKDAAVSAVLAPGSYFVHTLGAPGTSGVVLVEVYELR